MNITVVFVPLLVLNNVRFHNYKNFPGFYKLLFIRKIDTGYFNCSSVTLKQQRKGKIITEKAQSTPGGITKTKKNITALI